MKIKIILFILATLFSFIKVVAQKNYSSIQQDTLHVGNMFWSYSNMFMANPDLILMGVVEQVDPVILSEDPVYPSQVSGSLNVLSIVFENDRAEKYPHNQKYLSGSMFHGLDVGDTVVVFLLQYESGFGVPGYEIKNCALGYRINHGEKSMGLNTKEVISLYSRSSPWDVTSTSPDQVLLWSEFDPGGYLFGIYKQKVSEEVLEEEEDELSLDDPVIGAFIQRTNLVERNEELDSLINLKLNELMSIYQSGSFDRSMLNLIKKSQEKYIDLLGSNADIIIAEHGHGGSIAFHMRIETVIIQKEARLKVLEKLIHIGNVNK